PASSAGTRSARCSSSAPPWRASSALGLTFEVRSRHVRLANRMLCLFEGPTIGVGCLEGCNSRLHFRLEPHMSVDRSTLEAKPREGSGKGNSRRLRAQGLVPAVVYGRHLDKPAHIA